MGSAEPQRRFDRFILDGTRGCLTEDGQEIPLRPKTFAVLQYLVKNEGRLISKDELLSAVWPNVIVTDDTLVQSIGELRKALGEPGAKLITTVPRRGYRFESAPTEPPQPTAKLHRWRWQYRLVIAFVLLFAVAGLWMAMRDNPGSATAAADQRPAIAVLPFQNQGDPEFEYLSDGLTQDLIQSLGRFSGLTVMSWNAVAGYRGVPVRPGDIARSLDVRYQVEGSVRHTAGQVRVSAQLVDARGRVLWSAILEEPRADSAHLPDRITREIAGALSARVTEFEQQRVAAKPAASFDAYDLVLRARPLLRHPTRGGIVEARTLLRDALARDPHYGAAHSALGETFHIAISMGWAESPDDYWQRARAEADAALALDPGDVNAHVLLGRVHIAYNRYDDAERQMQRAIELNPSEAEALAGRGNILMWLGRTDAAIETLELAQRIDPSLSAFDRFALSLAYYLNRRYDAAIELAETTLRGNEDARFTRVVLAAALGQTGRNAEAARVADTIRRTDPAFDASAFGSKFVRSGDLAHLREGLHKAGLY